MREQFRAGHVSRGAEEAAQLAGSRGDERAEVGLFAHGSEEFVFTRLDAARVSVVRAALDNLTIVVVVLTVLTAAYSAAALRRELRSDQQILDDLGLSRRHRLRWQADLVGTAVASICAAVLVAAETGGHIPLSGWLRVLPVVGIPLVAAAVAAGINAAHRRTSAWVRGFSND